MKKTWAAAIIGVSMCLCTGMGAYAGANLQEISAYLNGDLKVKVDGKPIQLQDEQGSVILPITYDGSTYLPVRAISNALNVAVDWDAETSTVLLGEKPEGVSIDTEKLDDTHITQDPEKTKFAGKDYKAAIVYDDGDSLMLYPKQKYQKLLLQIAAINGDVEMEFKDSDSFRTLKKAVVKPADGMQTIEVEIGGVNDIYAEISVADGGSFFIPLTTSYYK